MQTGVEGTVGAGEANGAMSSPIRAKASQSLQPQLSDGGHRDRLHKGHDRRSDRLRHGIPVLEE